MATCILATFAFIVVIVTSQIPKLSKFMAKFYQTASMIIRNGIEWNRHVHFLCHVYYTV